MKTLESIVVKCAKGQFLSIVAETNVSEMDEKQYKKSPFLGRLTKRTTYNAVRFCDYENLSSTKEKREQGIEAQKPTWWEWVEFPYVARHKSKGTKYIVVKPTDKYPTSEYFIDGIKVDYEDIKYCLKKTSNNEPSVFMLKVDSVTYLAQNNVLFVKE